MGHGTWVLWCCVVRCALYQYICISLYFFCYRTLFFHCVLCSSRLAASNGVVANALDHTKIQRHHQANPPGHVLERQVPRWIIWL